MVNKIEPERVLCKICGNPTTMTGTKLCDACWELSKFSTILVNKSPTAALQFFEGKVLELKMRIQPKKKKKELKFLYKPERGMVT